MKLLSLINDFLDGNKNALGTEEGGKSFLSYVDLKGI